MLKKTKANTPSSCYSENPFRNSIQKSIQNRNLFRKSQIIKPKTNKIKDEKAAVTNLLSVRSIAGYLFRGKNLELENLNSVNHVGWK